MQLLVFIFLILLFGAFLWRKKFDVLYIITITFLTIGVCCFCHSLFMAFKDLDFSMEWLTISLGFAFIILVVPVLFSVIIFKYFLKKYIGFKNSILCFSIRFLVTFFIIQASFFCWAILDMQFFDFNYEYTLPNILNAYRSNYLDFMPASFLIPASIMYLDNWYEKRRGSNKKAAVPVEASDPENKS